jgi:hypothetical protein
MLSREGLGCHQQRIGPLVPQFNESGFQLVEVSRPHRLKQNVRLIGGDFGFPDALSHAWIR